MHYLLAAAIVLLMLVAIPTNNPKAVNAAAGVNGTITVGVSSILLDSPVAIKCYDMDVSKDYAVMINTTNWINWTNGADETSKVFYRSFTTTDYTTPTTYVIKVALCDGGANELDVIYLNPTTVDTFFPDELIFALFIPILIAVILVAIVLAIKGRKRS